MVWCSAVQHTTVQQYSSTAVQHKTIQYNTKQYKTIRYNTAQHGTLSLQGDGALCCNRNEALAQTRAPVL